MDNESSHFDLSGECYGNVRGVDFDFAVLPWGSTEPHNFHLPYLTDCILAHDIAVDAVVATWREYHVRGMVLPPISLGSQNPGQRELPFCIHTRYATQFAVLGDIVASLYHQGMKKLVIMSGHGGNCFKPMIRDLAVDYPDMLFVVCEWFSIVPRKGYFEEMLDDHAGEQETSVMMHYHPELVDLARAGDGCNTPFAIDGLKKKVGWTPRHWNYESADTGVGNPLKSTPEKGKNYMEAVIPRIAALFFEIATKPLYDIAAE